MKKGEYGRAIPCFRRAIQLGSKDWSLKRNVFDCLQYEKRYFEAFNFCEEVLREFPGNLEFTRKREAMQKAIYESGKDRRRR